MGHTTDPIAKVNFPPIPKGTPSDSLEWAKDPRIAYSQVTGKWIFEDVDNGDEYEFNEEVRSWVPILEEEDIKSQQQAYQPPSKRSPDREDESKHEDTSTNGSKRTKKPKLDQPSHKERKPTGIYLSNLPKDVTYEELDTTFSKYGVIAEDLNTGNKKIKIYRDDKDQPKGDALIVYFKPESVPLAIEMMDNSELRPGEPGRNPNGKIAVQLAEYKHSEDNHEKPKLNAKEKLKIQKKLQKLNE
ncbi:Cus2p [Sugiyamaella lignohabitans]|uniref:Cus2p n=1 Tax=Sugiyamaella lignohabitans TaxID=796027 RepID=A0A167EET4_9ASCO|nr:Cus2p [Sugiyamaella lignohabitans]ANB13986.1 Cus2p [Sugiyamaella lignohabitans]